MDFTLREEELREWDEANRDGGEEFDLEFVLQLRKVRLSVSTTPSQLMLEGQTEELLDGSDDDDDSDVMSVRTALTSAFNDEEIAKRKHGPTHGPRGNVPRDVLAEMKRVVREVEFDDERMTVLDENEKMNVYTSAYRHIMHSRAAERAGMHVRTIWIYRNGDKHHRGTRAVLSDSKGVGTTLSSMERLRLFVSSRVRLSTGPCRQFFDVTGQKVNNWEDFSHGGRYIACGPEDLDINNIPVASMQPIDVGVKYSGGASRMPALPSMKEMLAERSVASYKPVKIFGTQADTSPTITVLLNNSRRNDSCTLVVNLKIFKSIDQVLQRLTTLLKPPTGRIKRLCSLDGKTTIRTIEQLENGALYVALGPGETVRPMTQAAMDKAAKSTRRPEKKKEDEVVEKTVIATKPVFAGRATILGKRPIIVYVHRNGDKRHEGERIIVRTDWSWDKFLEMVSKEVKLPTGAVRKLYDAGGRRISATEQLEEGGRFIACGGEQLNNVLSDRK